MKYADADHTRAALKGFNGLDLGGLKLDVHWVDVEDIMGDGPPPSTETLLGAQDEESSRRSRDRSRDRERDRKKRSERERDGSCERRRRRSKSRSRSRDRCAGPL